MYCFHIKIVFILGLREVKASLNELEKPELIKLISELYKTIPEAKSYFDIYATSDYSKTYKDYVKKIERLMTPYPSSGRLGDKGARDLVRKVRKLKVPQLTIDVELFYVECAIELIASYGMSDAYFYDSTANIFYSAVNAIADLPERNKYKVRVERIFNEASEHYLEFEYPDFLID